MASTPWEVSWWNISIRSSAAGPLPLSAKDAINKAYFEGVRALTAKKWLAFCTE
jgi:hypothetical protein